MEIVEHLLARADHRLAHADQPGAHVLLDEILVLAPRHLGALSRIVTILLAGDPARAVLAGQDLAAWAPADPEAHAQHGRALAASGRIEDALAAFATAAALSPRSGDAHANHALALLRAGRPAPALEAADRAVALAPALPEAQANRGHALHALRRPDDALAAFAATLRLRPEHPDALLGIASVQTALGRPATAAATLQRACRAAPGWAGAWMDLGTALLATGHPTEAVAAYAQARQLAPQDLAMASNHLQSLQYDPATTAAAAAAQVRAWGAALPVHPRPDRQPSGPLRIGYLFGDIRQHPVGWLGGGAIAAHDPASVAVHVYANQADADAVTHLVASRVQTFRHVAGLGDSQLAALISRTGSTCWSTWPGNNAAKLNPALTELWARVLHAVPGSRLVFRWSSFSDPQVVAGLTHGFAAHGIEAARLEFAGAAPHPAMLAAYAGIDVALDPRPFCGGVTTAEALWMGVPVVTWPGGRPASRQSLAILEAIGHGEWATDGAEAYVAMAASLATDQARLAALRGSLREQMRASPLCDARRLAGALEDAYRALAV